MNDRMSILATLGVAVAALSAASVWVSWKSHTPQAMMNTAAPCTISET